MVVVPEILKALLRYNCQQGLESFIQDCILHKLATVRLQQLSQIIYEQFINYLYQNQTHSQQYSRKYLMNHEICERHNEPLDLVCLDTECQLRGIICSYCEFQSHKHPVKCLTVLIKQIQQDCEPSLNNMIILSKIDQIYSQTLENLATISNLGDRKILQETIHLYYEDLCRTLNKKQAQSKKLLNNQIKTSQELNSFLLKYQFPSKEQNINNLGNFQYFLTNRLQSFQSNLKQMKESIVNQEPIQKLLTIFTIEDQKKIKYWFNSQKMHKQIILIDSSKVKIKDGYSYRIAILDPPIRKQNGKTLKKSCTFKIGTIGAMIGVGVCYKKKAENLSYIFSAYSQHGCYFVANNGYTYNQSQKNYNSQIKNWTFIAEDIIKVTIIPKQKKISFKKEGNDPFEFPYQQKPQLELNFAVMMCSNNQSVEVLHV